MDSDEQMELFASGSIQPQPLHVEVQLYRGGKLIRTVIKKVGSDEEIASLFPPGRPPQGWIRDLLLGWFGHHRLSHRARAFSITVRYTGDLERSWEPDPRLTEGG